MIGKEVEKLELGPGEGSKKKKVMQSLGLASEEEEREAVLPLQSQGGLGKVSQVRSQECGQWSEGRRRNV